MYEMQSISPLPSTFHKGSPRLSHVSCDNDINKHEVKPAPLEHSGPEDHKKDPVCIVMPLYASSLTMGPKVRLRVH